MLIFSALSMIAFAVLTFLNIVQIGIYASSYTIIYFALRLILNPKIRVKIDVLSLVLLGIFVYYVSERVLAILG